MYCLGIGDVTHDKSVCLVKNGKVVTAIEEERLTRIKHGLKIDPQNKYNILELGDYIHGVLNQYTLADRELIYSRSMQYCLDANKIRIEDVDCLVISSLFQDLPFRHKAVFIHHHLAHCASAFYPSPFSEAAILAVDGYGVHTEGKSESIMYAIGKNNKIEILDTIIGYHDFTTEEKKKPNIDHRTWYLKIP